MQITDINDFISTAAQLLNAPDLILIAVLLANVWLNPMILISTPEKMAQRCQLYNDLMRPQLGFDLLDEEMLQKYIEYCSGYTRTMEEKGGRD